MINVQQDIANITGNLYYYSAVVKNVHDGDTITLDIDLGLKTWVHGIKIRLSRINAPELKTTEGKVSFAELYTLALGKQVIIQTERDKTEKYGRLLGEVWINTTTGWLNINDWLVSKNLAEYKKY